MAYKIDVKKVTKLQYTEVGKDVIAATIGGTLAGAAHFMFLGPQFPGQTYGVNNATIIDFIVAGAIGIATALVAKTPMAILLGLGAAGTLATVGLLQQFGIIPTAALGVRVARLAPRLAPTPARARYLSTAPRAGAATLISRTAAKPDGARYAVTG